MIAVAERLMPALGFDQSMFNVEFFVGDDGSVKIVEVNGRMASQFAPLVRAVHGVSSYELQLELAAGGGPEVPPRRDGVVAASFVLRTFQDAIVRSIPHTWPVSERFPGSQIELLVREGQRLSENDDDPVSHRLAVVALSGDDRAELVALSEQVAEQLPFDLQPVAVAAAQNS
jgi:hypothetical protein